MLVRSYPARNGSYVTHRHEGQSAQDTGGRTRRSGGKEKKKFDTEPEIIKNK